MKPCFLNEVVIIPLTIVRAFIFTCMRDQIALEDEVKTWKSFSIRDDLFGETKDIVWVVIMRKFINMVKLYI